MKREKEKYLITNAGLEITVEDLEEYYYRLGNKATMRLIGIKSNRTLVKYLGEAGIKLKGKGNRRPRPIIKIREM